MRKKEKGKRQEDISKEKEDDGKKDRMRNFEGTKKKEIKVKL